MIPVIYRGSVKDVLGPLLVERQSSVIFEYSDSFSVFDWGRMPDLLHKKGEALAVLAASLFERFERADTWKEFSRSPMALAMRKANRFGAVFNEIGEELQSSGLRTHYLGVLEPTSSQSSSKPWSLHSLSQVQSPFRKIAVRQVHVVKPHLSSILGRVLPDYYPTRHAPTPKLIPLEVVFRFSCPEGSSLMERAGRDPAYMASIGFPDVSVNSRSLWDFPVLELFTKLEATDRPVSLSEALAISGLLASQLQEILLKTAWVGALLRHWLAQLGLELADGKIEWAIDAQGKCFLVDAIGPDELRILKDGIQLSKEFLRNYYRNSSWYQSVENAKGQAKWSGVSDWKKLVAEAPPALPSQVRDLASQMYLSLANELAEKKWFSEARGIQSVVEECQGLSLSRASF
ncbi:MAG: phosphoribosylaminoimidazolesuccinocarboxamide synthase [Bdellovibrionia bacterium]